MSNSHRLIVIVKQRPWDEATWKRLILAYAYAIYDQRRNEQAEPTTAAASEAAQV